MSIFLEIEEKMEKIFYQLNKLKHNFKIFLKKNMIKKWVLDKLMKQSQKLTSSYSDAKPNFRFSVGNAFHLNDPSRCEPLIIPSQSTDNHRRLLLR